MRSIGLLLLMVGCSHSSLPGTDGGSAGDMAGGSGGGGTDGGSGSVVLPRGSVTGSTSVTCPNGVVAGATCTRVTVQCPGLEDITATIAVAQPASPTGATVVFHDGGGGQSMFSHGNVPTLVLQKGIRTVQVAWMTPWEVSAMAHSALAAACRPATLLDYIFVQVHNNDRAHGFCGLGHSGGSGMLAYVLSHYGLGDTLDLAMLSAGPPFGRIDVGCAPSTYTGTPITECPGQTPDIANAPLAYDTGFAGPFLNMIEGTTTCANGTPSSADLMRWAADSVASPGASYAFPQTQLSLWYCGIKPNETTGLGYLWHTNVTSQKDVHCVGGMCSGEDVYADPPTVTAMVDAIVSGCVPRHQ